MASGDIEKPFCRICKTVFNFKGPEPYLLPCLHPACKPCVDIENETITCKTCQELFRKADHIFPRDYLLNNSILQTALKHTPSDIICTNRNDGAKANTWCPKCEAFLCITCQEFHKETKATRSHVVESLQSYTESDNECSKTLAFCMIHQDHPLEMFDSSCGRLVCYKCLKVDHSTCSVEDIDEAFEKMKESELDNNIEQIVSKLDFIYDTEQKAQDLTKKLKENSKRVQDEVINTFSDIRLTLDMREKMILEETSKSFLEVQNTNRERMEVLQQEKTRCEAALRFIRTSKEISDPVQALMMKKTIDDRTTACIEADLQEMDGRESSISLSTQDLKDVKQSITTFASLMFAYDQDTLKETFSGPTTQEKQNKELLQLQKKVTALQRTLRTIPGLFDKQQKKGKLDLKIPGISSVKTDTTFESKTMYINNMPWYLFAQFAKEDEDDGVMLGLYICPIPGRADVIEVGQKWTCGIIGNFELSNSFSKHFVKKRASTFEFSDQENSGWGFGSWISKKELQDPLKGFAQDDCVHVSVDIEIVNTTGFLSLEEVIKKKCMETWTKVIDVN